MGRRSMPVLALANEERGNGTRTQLRDTLIHLIGCGTIVSLRGAARSIACLEIRRRHGDS